MCSIVHPLLIWYIYGTEELKGKRVAGMLLIDAGFDLLLGSEGDGRLEETVYGCHSELARSPVLQPGTPRRQQQGEYYLLYL